MNWLSAARRQKKKAVAQQTCFHAPMKRRLLDNQSRRFFAFTQTYDEFYGNIIANSIVYALKISEKLMIVEI